MRIKEVCMQQLLVSILIAHEISAVRYVSCAGRARKELWSSTSFIFKQADQVTTSFSDMSWKENKI